MEHQSSSASASASISASSSSVSIHPRNPPRAADGALACLLQLTDELMLVPMLVNTRASTSFLPSSRVISSLSATKHHLVGAGVATIFCYRSRMTLLQFQGRRFTWDFEVADILVSRQSMEEHQHQPAGNLLLPLRQQPDSQHGQVCDCPTPGDIPWEFTFTEEMLKAIANIKILLRNVKNLPANATLLVHPIRNAMLCINTDASDCAIGGVPHQHHCGRLQPLDFFSWKLNDAEINYSNFDPELLAVAAAVEQFQHVIEGRHVIIYMDHKPLVSSITKPNYSSSWSQRSERRHLLFISQYTTDIRHVAGESNKVVDALSRSALPPTSPAEDHFTNDFIVQESFQTFPSPIQESFQALPSPSPTLTPSSPSPSALPSTSQATGRTGVTEWAAGLSTTRPSHQFQQPTGPLPVKTLRLISGLLKQPRGVTMTQWICGNQFRPKNFENRSINTKVTAK